MQVIVYAGAILVFYLFVLMLLDLPGEESRPRFGRHWPLAAAGAVGFATLAWLSQSKPPGLVTGSDRGAGLFSFGPGVAPEGPAMGSLAEAGIALFGTFALPLEIAGLVLLAAIVGAVVLSRRRAES